MDSHHVPIPPLFTMSLRWVLRGVHLIFIYLYIYNTHVNVYIYIYIFTFIHTYIRVSIYIYMMIIISTSFSPASGTSWSQRTSLPAVLRSSESLAEGKGRMTLGEWGNFQIRCMHIYDIYIYMCIYIYLYT